MCLCLCLVNQWYSTIPSNFSHVARIYRLCFKRMRNENAMRSAGSCLLHSGNQLLRVASRPQTQTTRIAKENRWMQIFFKENALMAFNSKPNDDGLLAWHATLSPILFFLHVSLGLNVYREQLLMFRLSYR